MHNDYNEIGELISKKLHSEDQGTSYAQSVDYQYNIRGWLTDINDPDDLATDDDYFGMSLKYDNPASTSGLSSVAQYNGNICEIHWNSENSASTNRKAYGFQYDKLNRLKTSTYAETTSYNTHKNFYNENIGQYDFNGNITGLTRNGNGTSTNNIDDLNYTYNGNQLTGVSDGATGADAALGFMDGNASGDDYAYDDNGNMTEDLNKGISNISYNYLNLPEQITFNNGNSIQYIYDASGMKLEKQVTENSTTTTTDYVGPMVYEGTNDVFLNTEEGRVVLKEGGTAKEEYQYNLKDHLGNVRVTFTTASSQQMMQYLPGHDGAAGEQPGRLDVQQPGNYQANRQDL